MTATLSEDARPTGRAQVDPSTRIERLADAAGKRVIDPDRDIPGALGDGQILPDDLLSLCDLGLDLTAEQKAKLSREEGASMLDMGARMESILNTGFSMMIAQAPDLTDPRVRFLLHEIGEETRHQRMFIRLIDQIRPTAADPMRGGAMMRRIERLFINRQIAKPAFFHVLVLAGEEIPDLLQRRAVEHEGTDPFLREVNRYHRSEEARHLSYARTVFPELWLSAGPVERQWVRHVGPRVISQMFSFFVHPGVYASIGLPAWPTWKQVNASPTRLQMRYEATRPILQVLLDADVFDGKAVPSGWRELCHVDEAGRPLA